MSIFEKQRFEIWNQGQHPLKHSIGDFAYYNSALPWVTNLEGVMDALVSVAYPNTKEAVATFALLPTRTDTPTAGDVEPTPLDYRVVLDDGDDKAAGYRWEKREGEANYSWHKIYDMDWGEDSILSNFLTKTNDTYVSKKGQDDIDGNGDLLTGDLAGQYIYGGSSADSHLTLYANSGDGTGAQTGFVQVGDQVRPLFDATISLGTLPKQFKELFLSDFAKISTLSLSSGVIEDSSGDISFGSNNLTSTGVLTINEVDIETFADMAQIATPTNPAAGRDKLYFKADDKLYRLDAAGLESLVGLIFSSTHDNRLVRSDGVSGEAIQESGIIIDDDDSMVGITRLTVDSLELNANIISTTSVDADLLLSPNGAGIVKTNNVALSSLTDSVLMAPNATGVLESRIVTLSALGELAAITKLDVDNIQIDGNSIQSTNVDGNLLITPNGTGSIVVGSNVLPNFDNSIDLGSTALNFENLYIDGFISDGNKSITTDTLLSFGQANTGAAVGMSLFFDGADWIPSLPDTEIDHGTISGLGDDDHLQYVAKDGRATGQTVVGGTADGENLTLSSTSSATKGSVIFEDTLKPNDDGLTDIGEGSHQVKNLYIKGEAIGLRVENVTSGTLPAAGNVGRLCYVTDTKQLIVDDGLAWQIEGVNKYREDLVFDGVVVSKDVDVSAAIVDARNCTIQLLNNNNDFDRIYCTLKATSSSNVRIETNSPLPAGSYRLVVIE